MGNASGNMTGLTGPRVSLLSGALVLMVTAAILAATVLTRPAEAQDPAGAIRNLSVSSPNPSQLVLTWDAPTATPTDYRVRWAPSGQDYLSYSEDNTSERGSAYPLGPEP